MMTSPSLWARARGDIFAFAACGLVLLLGSLPSLFNAAGTHSDAAVVGLQAVHLLQGEKSFFLWGSGYQTSADSWVAAGFFRVFGPTPLALMLSTFTGYLVLTGFVYATLRRRFEPAPATILVAPLVVMAAPMRIYAFHPPRQAALTLLFAAIWALDGARARRGPSAWLALGAVGTGLACLADPYCLLFVPAILLLIVLTARELDSPRPALVVGIGGVFIGLVPLWILAHARGATRGVYGFTGEVFARNLRLLTQECLPFLLGTRVATAGGAAWWHPPVWFHVVQLAGAGSLMAGIALGGLMASSRAVPPGERGLGAFGALMLPITLAAFLFSVMAIDRWSARYLVSIVLVAPFALAPVVRLAGFGRFALMLAPYVLSTAIGGWLSNGSDVAGWRIRRENGTARDEHALGSFLRARGLRYGIADYWVAYRLTFLFRENPILVPCHPTLDRYAPYRRAVEAERVVAYVYDPWWSKEDLGWRKEAIREGKTDFDPTFEEARVGRYTVLFVRRARPAGPRIAGSHVATHDGPS